MSTTKYSVTIEGDSIPPVAAYGSISHNETTCFTQDFNTVTDEAIDLGSITAVDWIYLNPSAAATIKINSSATAYTLDASKPFFHAGTNITAVTVTTAGDCRMTVILGGA